MTRSHNESTNDRPFRGRMVERKKPDEARLAAQTAKPKAHQALSFEL